MEDEFLFYKEKDFTLYKGKMQDVLSTFEENSIDSIVCDPPYELSFMNKGWDNSGVAFDKETWKHCFKVLKEGGYLLAFGGTRTFHRIACAIEDAGFEIRDTIMWLYGSGFPKSMNIGLAVDKKNGVESKVVGKYNPYRDVSIRKHIDNSKFSNIAGTEKKYIEGGLKDLKEPTLELAKKWQGWGTCLKPAYEPIIVARKPFKGSLVDNVIENGVGGINIDECRVETNDNIKSAISGGSVGLGEMIKGHKYTPNDLGRFPANVILTYDETDFEEVCGGMPDTKSTYNKDNQHERIIHRENAEFLKYGYKERIDASSYNDEGSASRYFYCAKASKKDRDEGLDWFEYQQTTDGCIRANSETARKFGANSALRKNIHPTVKPVELMQYLVRLVSPKGAKVLDCFMGSGSTGKACMFENRERNANYHFIGIEMTDEYLPIAKTRIDYAKYKYQYDEIKEKEERKEKGIVNLFDLLEEEGN